MTLPTFTRVRIFANLLKEDPYRKLLVAFFLLAFITLIGVGGYWAFGQYYHQDWSVLDCIYMTVISLTTVGYGEVLPIEHLPSVRIFTMLLILAGMGIIVFFVSNLTAFIVEGELQKIIWRRKMQKRIDSMKDHIIVCGAGDTGWHIIEELKSTGYDCVVIDISEERCAKMREKIGDFPFIIGDATEDEVLMNAGIKRAKGIIAALNNDKDNLVITITARQSNPKIRIVAKSIGIGFDQKLRRAGAQAVVTPNRIGGLRMASEMVRPVVVSFLDKMLRLKEQVMRIEEVEIQDGSPAVGKNLMQLDIRKRLELSVVAIFNHHKGTYEYNPDPEQPLEVGDVLICLGEMDSIHQFRQELAPRQ